MCLIMTFITAIVFTVLYFVKRNQGFQSKSLLTATLMFGAASLMWSIDGIAAVLEGEGFFDISWEDTILGAIIVASGLLIFGFLEFAGRRKARAE